MAFTSRQRLPIPNRYTVPLTRDERQLEHYLADLRRGMEVAEATGNYALKGLINAFIRNRR